MEESEVLSIQIFLEYFKIKLRIGHTLWNIFYWFCFQSLSSDYESKDLNGEKNNKMFLWKSIIAE